MAEGEFLDELKLSRDVKVFKKWWWGEDHCTSEIHSWTVLLFRIMANDLADGNNKAALIFADAIYCTHSTYTAAIERYHYKKLSRQ